MQITPSGTGDALTGVKDEGLLNRTAPPDRFQGPVLATVIEEALGGAQGKTVNIGARNDPYGTGLADTFGKAWEAKGGQIGERVIYDPEQPSYNSEASQIVGGNPDGYVIIDFPATYENVGPALVRTGEWDAEEDVHHRRSRVERPAQERRQRGDRGHARDGAGIARHGGRVGGVRQAVHGRPRPGPPDVRLRRTSTP